MDILSSQVWKPILKIFRSLKIWASPAGKILLIKSRKIGGSGIPANMMPRIFEAFFQAGEKVLGSGIGLNLTKSIIELHGGRIWIDNKRRAWNDRVFHPPIR